MDRNDGYRLLAGKCAKIAAAIAKACPEFRVAKGYYHCPHWGKRGHFWLVAQDGTIYDPTIWQFPTETGAYEEIHENSEVECDQCGKRIPLAGATIGGNGNYVFCNGRCYGKYVGVAVDG